MLQDYVKDNINVYNNNNNKYHLAKLYKMMVPSKSKRKKVLGMAMMVLST
jgi:hypothetical protein